MPRKIELSLRFPTATIEGRMRSLENPTRLKFCEPVLNSAQVHSELPPDVVSEWSGNSDCSMPDPQTRIQTDRDRESTGLFYGRSGALGGELDIEASPIRTHGIQEYPIDQEALLFDPSTQILYQLNETAFAVWSDCDGRTVRDLAQGLTTRFEVDFETSLRHTKDLVGLFRAGALLSLEAAGVLEG